MIIFMELYPFLSTPLGVENFVYLPSALLFPPFCSQNSKPAPLLPKQLIKLIKCEMIFKKTGVNGGADISHHIYHHWGCLSVLMTKLISQNGKVLKRMGGSR